MIKKNILFSVLTGDVVNSSRLDNQNRVKLPVILKASFNLVKSILPDAIHSPFTIFRGDSFQGVLLKPADALKAALLIRAQLIFNFSGPLLREAIDARIAIGIGTINFLPKNRKSSEGDGQAFQLSGSGLDNMKKHQHLVIRTPWNEIDEEFATECALLDGLINHWSAAQAEAVLKQLQGLTQEDMARKIGITQPAVVSRLKAAEARSVEVFCKRFASVITARQNISFKAYNDGL